MAKGKRQTAGPMSSAGLVRYYESEDKNAIHINPRSILVACVLSAAIILALNFMVAR
ncbi:MAG: preprotein translocase subunit Sec61beta [Halobacteriota archaeon]|nr:preprotein translocase subunit Sec61beta [Candidatus Bathyarchaeia archaeon]